MSGEGLAGVLLSHAQDGKLGACHCNWEPAGWSEEWPREHAAHVAAAVFDWLRGVVADEGVREAVWYAVASARDASPRRADDADSHDVADAALAAFLTALGQGETGRETTNEGDEA